MNEDQVLVVCDSLSLDGWLLTFWTHAVSLPLRVRRSMKTFWPLASKVLRFLERAVFKRHSVTSQKTWILLKTLLSVHNLTGRHTQTILSRRKTSNVTNVSFVLSCIHRGKQTSERLDLIGTNSASVVMVTKFQVLLAADNFLDIRRSLTCVAFEAVEHRV